MLIRAPALRTVRRRSSKHWKIHALVPPRCSTFPHRLQKVIWPKNHETKKVLKINHEEVNYAHAGQPSGLNFSQKLLIKNPIFLQTTHFENLNFDKIHNFKVLFFTRFTFWKSHFWQIHIFKNLIFHKIHISKFAYLTKFTFPKYLFSQNSHFQIHIFDKIHIS